MIVESFMRYAPKSLHDHGIRIPAEGQQES